MGTIFYIQSAAHIKQKNLFIFKVLLISSRKICLYLKCCSHQAGKFVYIQSAAHIKQENSSIFKASPAIKQILLYYLLSVYIV